MGRLPAQDLRVEQNIEYHRSWGLRSVLPEYRNMFLVDLALMIYLCPSIIIYACKQLLYAFIVSRLHIPNNALLFHLMKSSFIDGFGLPDCRIFGFEGPTTT